MLSTSPALFFAIITDKDFHAFYNALNENNVDSSSKEVRNKVKKLLSTMKQQVVSFYLALRSLLGSSSWRGEALHLCQAAELGITFAKFDIKRVSKMWSENDKQNTLKDVTNVAPFKKRSREADFASSSKMRKLDEETDDNTSSKQQKRPDNVGKRELPHSITRSEVYKSINFKQVTVEYFLRPTNKLLKISESVRSYLDTKPKPVSKSAEGELQTWFNGLMENGDLEGLMPDISDFENNDVEERAFVSKYAHTVFEIKKQKQVSGLADEDKGQLLDYIRVLLQQQPLRQVFASNLLLSGVSNDIHKRVDLIFADDFSNSPLITIVEN
ncbi:11143_t:CDS:2 [Funneliformis mosseae]|uniref:11143_t:CDS:1 n=1 Tax=Funneliformis mosseae TaxID=27381 RepID=A0A9N9E8Z7_FUNMO|nr:11143_t:CDS:2 [Funneliformis mosseae]